MVELKLIIMQTATTLNKTQLEILQMFKSDLSENELLELKRMFVRFLAEKAKKMGNEIWEEKGWTNEDMKRMAKEHMPL